MADAPPAPGGPTFEQHLKAIRERRGVSLEALQTETRLPEDILVRFEDGQLLGDGRYNEVYVKTLLRAYADAVGIPLPDVMEGYEAHRGGRYDGSLARHLGEEPSAPAAPPEPEPEPEPPPTPPPASGVAPAVAALSGSGPKPPPKPKAAPTRPNEHFEKARVRTEEQERRPVQPIDRSWGLVIGGAVTALIIIAGVLYLLFRDTAPELEPDEDALVAVDTAAVETPVADTAAAAEPAPVGDAPRLQLPIAVTVAAAGGPLQNFRVQAEPDVRRPYWMEEGTSQTFTSPTAVIVWGTESGGSYSIPSEARLQLQGYEWSPRAVQRIDAARGQAILDSLHRAGAGQP